MGNVTLAKRATISEELRLFSDRDVHSFKGCYVASPNAVAQMLVEGTKGIHKVVRENWIITSKNGLGLSGPYVLCDDGKLRPVPLPVPFDELDAKAQSALRANFYRGDFPERFYKDSAYDKFREKYLKGAEHREFRAWMYPGEDRVVMRLNPLRHKNYVDNSGVLEIRADHYEYGEKYRHYVQGVYVLIPDAVQKSLDSFIPLRGGSQRK
jgi:hypothetical protein